MYRCINRARKQIPPEKNTNFTALSEPVDDMNDSDLNKTDSGEKLRWTAISHHLQNIQKERFWINLKMLAKSCEKHKDEQRDTM